MEKNVLKERENLEFRHQPLNGSPDFDLIRFIKHQKTLQQKTAKEIVLDALRAFWLPIALKSSQEYNQEDLKKVWLDSIYSLEKQKEYLMQLSEIELLPQRTSLKKNRKNAISLKEVELEKQEEEEEILSNSGMIYEDLEEL
jgi:hypothetical protein